MPLDTVIYVLVAIVFYVAALAVVRLIERRLGRSFANRPLIFLVVFLVLLVVVLKLAGFEGILEVFQGRGGVGAPS